MVEKSVTIQLDSGLQARPAAQFVQEANRFQSHIILEKDGKQVNAKSIMGIMSLAITKGETVKLIVEGDDAEAAMSHLVTFVTSP
ncbi:MAG TPA: HPr family phosphocarrier protein [Bacillota bacterium]|nr:HPr family phosphocarrier protein [Bacillota bacterium]